VSAVTYPRRASLLALTMLALSSCAEEAQPGGGGAGPIGGDGTGGPDNTGGSNFGGGNSDGGGVTCMSTSAKATVTPLDIIFMLDWSQGMETNGTWSGTKEALETFFYDPLSFGINAGLIFSPTIKPHDNQDDAQSCNIDFFKVPDVPIGPLPTNAFALSNAMPAEAVGTPTPLYAALAGTLMAATAHQDAHPTHKVIVVMTGDGDYNSCGPGGINGGLYNINAIAAWASEALAYNGVRTYVVSVQGSPIECPDTNQQCVDRLQKIAEAGGSEVVYDAADISEFSEKMVEIRKAVLGCDFEIPDPPNGEFIVPDEVNFTYTPGGEGSPIYLPRADDLADCGGEPGWYFDNNQVPTKIIVCPASCATIQNDQLALVNAEFGCASIAN
jgi:hypothetical protein